MPSQNAGSDWPSAAKPIPSRSHGPPRFTAERTPSGMLITSVTAMAAVASLIELTKRSLTSSTAGRRVRSDVPQSPRSASRRNAAYWYGIGRSKPMRRMYASRSAGVASAGRMRSTGLPEVRTSAKTMKLEASSVTSAWRTRATRKRAIRGAL